MKIRIDEYAGFCSGVINAIIMAEKYASSESGISCLGEIVHNSQEEKRLNILGMNTVRYSELRKLKGKRVLIRAHGEPPETYILAKNFDIELLDATCPIVLNLQKKIKLKYEENPNSQIVIFGKKGHAEVNGLVGQTNGNAIVISNLNEASEIDLTKQTFVFSQTTSNCDEYEKLGEFMKKKSLEIHHSADNIIIYNTICPSVKNRIPRLKEFCRQYDTIIFVSDKKSSNGKMLFSVCQDNNPKSHFICYPEEIKKCWFNHVNSVGISGATSTPLWLMENVKNKIQYLLTK
ncbi:MAG TPA: 4-hydroxy-3-methylbut-2-enyl diphosphate reductase [Bacteroidales bacterium]|nr:4-hydroxy-3-methylbut-2-enyl diphosphate reductase [Bacteroidales bacterium]